MTRPQAGSTEHGWSGSRSPIPVYYQISRAIRQRIIEGYYEEHGNKIESEERLATEFGVSRVTVRQALQELAADDLIVTQRGRGSFVLDVDRTSIGYALRGDIEDLHATSNSVVSARIETVGVDHGAPLPPYAARRLNLQEPVGTVIRRVRRLADRPVGLLLNYLPDHLGRLVSAEALRTRGIFGLLTDQGVRITHAHQTVRAQHAEADAAETLSIGLGDPVMATERVSTDAEGAVIDFARSWYTGDSIAYVIEYAERD